LDLIVNFSTQISAILESLRENGLIFRQLLDVQLSLSRFIIILHGSQIDQCGMSPSMILKYLGIIKKASASLVLATK